MEKYLKTVREKRHNSHVTKIRGGQNYGKGGQPYGDGRRLDSGWRAHNGVYRRCIIKLYTKIHIALVPNVTSINLI